MQAKVNLETGTISFDNNLDDTTSESFKDLESSIQVSEDELHPVRPDALLHDLHDGLAVESHPEVGVSHPSRVGDALVQRLEGCAT